MTTDRELLELAAKAAGYTIEFWGSPDYYSEREGEVAQVAGLGEWNPLTDDGDALRLAVKLQLRTMPQEKCVYVESNPDTLLGFAGVSVLEMYGADPCAATCRAITRAAAEIGKQMKEQTP